MRCWGCSRSAYWLLSLIVVTTTAAPIAWTSLWDLAQLALDSAVDSSSGVTLQLVEDVTGYSPAPFTIFHLGPSANLSVLGSRSSASLLSSVDFGSQSGAYAATLSDGARLAVYNLSFINVAWAQPQGLGSVPPSSALLGALFDLPLFFVAGSVDLRTLAGFHMKRAPTFGTPAGGDSSNSSRPPPAAPPHRNAIPSPPPAAPPLQTNTAARGQKRVVVSTLLAVTKVAQAEPHHGRHSHGRRALHAASDSAAAELLLQHVQVQLTSCADLQAMGAAVVQLQAACRALPAAQAAAADCKDLDNVTYVYPTLAVVSYAGVSLTARDLNITCTPCNASSSTGSVALPAQTVVVRSGEDLLAALASAQSAQSAAVSSATSSSSSSAAVTYTGAFNTPSPPACSPSFTLALIANVSLAGVSLANYTCSGVSVPLGVTCSNFFLSGRVEVLGRPGALTVLDMGQTSNLVTLGTTGSAFLENVTIMNLVFQLPALLVYPMQAFGFTRLLNVSQLQLTNVTVVVSEDELTYATQWVMLAAAQTAAEAAAVPWPAITSAGQQIQSTTASSTLFATAHAPGLWGTNVTLSTLAPPAFASLAQALDITQFMASPSDPYPQVFAITNITQILAFTAPRAAVQALTKRGVSPRQIAVTLVIESPIMFPVGAARTIVNGFDMHVMSVPGAGRTVVDLQHQLGVFKSTNGSTLRLTELTLLRPASFCTVPCGGNFLLALDLNVFRMMGDGTGRPTVVTNVTMSVSAEEMTLWVALISLIRGIVPNNLASPTANPAALVIFSQFLVIIQNIAFSLAELRVVSQNSFVVDGLSSNFSMITNLTVVDNLMPYSRPDLSTISALLAGLITVPSPPPSPSPTPPSPSPAPPPPSPHTPASPPPSVFPGVSAQVGNSQPGTSDAAVIGGAVGGAVGGVALLVAALAAAFIFYRRRRDGSVWRGFGGAPAKPDVELDAELVNQQNRFLDTLHQKLARTGSDQLGQGGVSSEQSGSATPLRPSLSVGTPKPASGGSAGEPQPVSSSTGPSARSRPELTNELNLMSWDLQGSIQDDQLVIQAVIGSGAHGTVYLARWQGLPVAVKTLLFSTHSLGAGGGTTHGVLMEAALSKSITHPNVVATYSCDLKPIKAADESMAAMGRGANVLNDWRLYIIQEFCDGGTLRAAIESRALAENDHSPALPLDMVLCLAMGVASGMSHLHERNVIHGDLNPANVLLKRMEAAGPGVGSMAHDMMKSYASEADLRLGYVPKVADFGFSVHLPANMSHVSNTRRGTPFYVAPEVAERGNLSKAADVFAMGVMLWELCTGKSVWKVLTNGTLGLRNSFPGVPSGAPHGFSALVTACINYDHTRRPTFPQILEKLTRMQNTVAARLIINLGGQASFMSSPSGSAQNSRHLPPVLSALPGGGVLSGSPARPPSHRQISSIASSAAPSSWGIQEGSLSSRSEDPSGALPWGLEPGSELAPAGQAGHGGGGGGGGHHGGEIVLSLADQPGELWSRDTLGSSAAAPYTAFRGLLSAGDYGGPDRGGGGCPPPASTSAAPSPPPAAPKSRSLAHRLSWPGLWSAIASPPASSSSLAAAPIVAASAASASADSRMTRPALGPADLVHRASLDAGGRPLVVDGTACDAAAAAVAGGAAQPPRPAAGAAAAAAGDGAAAGGSGGAILNPVEMFMQLAVVRERSSRSLLGSKQLVLPVICEDATLDVVASVQPLAWGNGGGGGGGSAPSSGEDWPPSPPTPGFS